MKRSLLLGAVTALVLCWVSPAGAAPSRPIAAVKQGEVYVLKSTGLAQRITSTGGRAQRVAWMTDGKRVLFSKSGSSSVYWADVATKKSGKYPLAEVPMDSYTQFVGVESLAVSRDGKRLYVVHRTPGIEINDSVWGEFRLSVFDLKTRKGKALKWFALPALDSVTVRVGDTPNRLLVQLYRGDGCETYTIPSGGGAAVPLNAVDSLGAAFSRKHNRLGWVASIGDVGPSGSSVRVGSNKGGTGTKIADGSVVGESYSVSPAWSADEKYLFCVTSRGLWRVPTTTGTPRKIMHGAEAVACWWPPY